MVRESKDILLERLADRVAEVVISIDRVEAVEVTVTKSRPPVPEQLESTGVHIRGTVATTTPRSELLASSH